MMDTQFLLSLVPTAPKLLASPTVPTATTPGQHLRLTETGQPIKARTPTEPMLSEVPG